MSSNREKYILAVDLGTSGPKSALVSTWGEVADFEFKENQVLLLPKGGAEQRPDEWWDTIVYTAKKVLAKQLVPVDDIVAICCSTQWSGTVAVDKGGRPLMNAIIWLDSRGSRYVRHITGGLVKIEGYGILKLQRWLRLTGGIPSHSGKDPIAHILLLKNEYPDMKQEIIFFVLLNVDGRQERKIMDRLMQLEPVRELHSVHGAIDIIVKVVLVRDLMSSDAELISQFTHGYIRTLKGVLSSQTLIPGLSRIKDEPYHPL